MSDLENIKEGLRLYELGEEISLNQLRLLTEDFIDYYTNIINKLVGIKYSENDIIIEAKLNNMLFEANALYTTIIDLINK